MVVGILLLVLAVIVATNHWDVVLPMIGAFAVAAVIGVVVQYSARALGHLYLARRAGSYMDAPLLQGAFFDSGSQEEIAAIHSASVCGTWPRALMEYAG